MDPREKLNVERSIAENITDIFFQTLCSAFCGTLDDFTIKYLYEQSKENATKNAKQCLKVH